MLKIREFNKYYQTKLAIQVPALDIQRGEAVGIVGNNGAGKTTLFRCILDLVKPTAGYIGIDGEEVTGKEEWKQKLHAFVDESFLIPFLKPMEYFHFLGSARGLSNRETEAVIARYEELANEDILSGKKLIRDLSTGSRVRTGVLGTLLGKPEMILLDEPFAHLDPGSQFKLGKVLRQLNENGTAVVVSSHNLQNIAQVCKRIILIENGAVLRDELASEEAFTSLNRYFEK